MQAGHEGHASAVSQAPPPSSGLESVVSNSVSTGTSFAPQSGLESSFAGYQFNFSYVPYIALAAIGIYLAYRLVKYFASSITTVHRSG